MTKVKILVSFSLGCRKVVFGYLAMTSSVLAEPKMQASVKGLDEVRVLRALATCELAGAAAKRASAMAGLANLVKRYTRLNLLKLWSTVPGGKEQRSSLIIIVSIGTSVMMEEVLDHLDITSFGGMMECSPANSIPNVDITAGFNQVNHYQIKVIPK